MRHTISLEILFACKATVSVFVCVFVELKPSKSKLGMLSFYELRLWTRNNQNRTLADEYRRLNGSLILFSWILMKKAGKYPAGIPNSNCDGIYKIPTCFNKKKIVEEGGRKHENSFWY